MSDFSGIGDLAKDIAAVPKAAHRNVVKAIQFTSVEIKKDWQQGAARTGLQGYAASVDFDLKDSPYTVSSEIGPNLGRNQGQLGLVEDGGGDVHSAPQHAGRDALEANEDDFVRGLDIAASSAVIETIAKG